MRNRSLVRWTLALVAVCADCGRSARPVHGAPPPAPATGRPAGATPVAAATLRFTTLTAGNGFTCGLTADRTAWCWGANQYGQLGTPNAPDHCDRVDMMADGPCSLRPVQVAGGHRFVAIDAGTEHVCALDDAGAAYCWGKNVLGELGVAGAPEKCNVPFYTRQLPDYEPEACSRVPVLVATPLRFVAVSAGNSFSCVLTSEGRAYCWGSRRDGQLGAGRRMDHHPEVVAVEAPAPFTQISADGSLACALSRDGDVYCWGGNRSIDATLVQAPVKFTRVSRGWGQTCALTAEGRAYCWGSNDAGELGTSATSTMAEDSVPHPVAGDLSLQAVDAGFLSTCGITRSQDLVCWGDGMTLGADAPNRCFHVDAYSPCALAPVRVPLAHVASVAGGVMHRCALTTEGERYCWGSNESGAFGDGSTRSSRAPSRAPDGG